MASISPEKPPMVNRNRKASANSIGGSKESDPFHMVAVQLKTFTPVGTAISAPPKPVQIIGSLLPDQLKWKTFFSTQAKNPKYLRHGDVVEAAVATDDGAIDLGAQRTVVKYA